MAVTAADARGAAPAPAPPAAHPPAVRRRPFVVRNARILLAWLILLALLGVYAHEAPRFTAREQRSISNSGMTLTIASLGQTLVVLTGGIDLSVGPMVSLTNSVASRLGRSDDPNSMWLASLVVLLIGAAGGLVNGLLVAYGRLQPIIVTLATASIYGGIALYVRPDPGGEIPSSFNLLLTDLAFHRKVPRSFILLLLLIAGWLVFRRSRLATRIYAVGSSESAAYMSGIDVVRAKLWAYTLAGLAAGGAGLFFTAQTATGNAIAGNVYTLNSIAAVVLGGASLAGGIGSFLGTIAGAYVIAIIPSVLFFYGVNEFWKQFAQGSILLAAVALGAFGIFRIRNRLERL